MRSVEGHCCKRKPTSPGTLSLVYRSIAFLNGATFHTRFSKNQSLLGFSFLLLLQQLICHLFARMTDITEPPFRPREKLLERQKYFQNIHKHTYLKGPLDKITSVAIPIALAASSLYLIVRTGDLQHVAWYWEEGMRWTSCVDMGDSQLAVSVAAKVIVLYLMVRDPINGEHRVRD
ncbi:hypothetical protein TIFTF001_025393 [Ficus carica]|uniref:Uncharacterized protein n=1 Tax=Ficus carica TaxID=3494 RepID=A0AA88AJS9_FICCA|nr:hypothetical protein TIFTF001_025393 [Ficus carica]